jgi:monoamine oxidase
MLDEVRRELEALHPGAEVPAASGSALQHWGADPLEVAWQFWRPGFVSDQIMAVAPQPDPGITIHLAGETFSHSQSWIEGALESAQPVIDRLRRA